MIPSVICWVVIVRLGLLHMLRARQTIGYTNWAIGIITVNQNINSVAIIIGCGIIGVMAPTFYIVIDIDGTGMITSGVNLDKRTIGRARLVERILSPTLNFSRGTDCTTVIFSDDNLGKITSRRSTFSLPILSPTDDGTFDIQLGIMLPSLPAPKLPVPSNKMKVCIVGAEG